MREVCAPTLLPLTVSLDMLAEEGMDAVAARHARLGEGVRRAVHAWGLTLCARDPERRSNSVTAIVVSSPTLGP